MMEINLTFAGNEFKAQVDEDLYHQLLQDDDKRLEYAEMVYNLSKELLVDSETSEDTLGQTSNNPETHTWLHENIVLLLNYRLANEDEFNIPGCKKKKLWNAIAEEINKTADISVDGRICDIKYRNLLATYRANKRKSLEHGEEAVEWKYFKLFDKFLGSKNLTAPEEEHNHNIKIESLPEPVDKKFCLKTKLEQTHEPSTTFNWTHYLIKLMLNLRLGKEDEFNRPNCKKKKLWNAIADEMNKTANCSIDGATCDTKYRNVLSTYRKNKKKSLNLGELAINWKYFRLFDQVLGNRDYIVGPLEHSVYGSASPSTDEEDHECLIEESLIEVSSSVLNSQETKLAQTNETPMKWSDDMLKKLLQLRLDKDKQFSHRFSKKTKLWEALAAEMNSIFICNLDGSACDSKYRNLLHTYRINKQKSLQFGEQVVSWKFYKIFDKVLGNKTIFNYKTEDPLYIEQSEDESIQEEIQSNKNDTLPQVLLSLTKTLQGYCAKKLDLTNKNNCEILNFKKKMWEEKKALKVKEIEAINNLAYALNGRLSQAP